MNLTNERIQAILDGADQFEGLAEYHSSNWGYLYFNGDFMYFDGGYWTKLTIIPSNIHSLSDLREILTLRNRVKELENTIKQSLDNIEYAAFNLCETVDLASRCKGRVVESTCPETSLLIAIRDMKEALTPTKEREYE